MKAEVLVVTVQHWLTPNHRSLLGVDRQATMNIES